VRDLRYRLSDPTGRELFICRITRSSSSESHTSACPPSEKIPFVLIDGCTTTALNSPAGTLIRSRRRTRIFSGFRSGRK
jgi:hypothetical protein